MRRHRLLVLAAALLLVSLAACETDRQDPAVGVDADAATETDPALAEPGMETQLPAASDADGTARALEAGVTQVAPEDAIHNIDAWIARLEDTAFDGRDPVVQGLQDLRSALQQTPIDGRRVGEILSSLGENTTSAGAQAGHQQIERLGQVLTQAGRRLAGGEATTPTAPPPVSPDTVTGTGAP